jgi:hypothetical protein
VHGDTLEFFVEGGEQAAEFDGGIAAQALSLPLLQERRTRFIARS